MEDFPYLDIAREYEQAGAGAVSVLTEPEFFQGSPRYLEEIRKEVGIPLLRKDFTIDAYQIYQAKVLACAPDTVAFVAESGIKSREDIERLETARVNAVLIGETLMRSPDKKAMLDELRGKRS